MAKTLERVMKNPLEIALSGKLTEMLGVSIPEISLEISDKLEEKPLIAFEINTSVSFKVAKKIFKKDFLKKLIQTHYGNVREVARLIGIDRRSIHRAINDLDIDIKKCRTNLFHKEYYQVQAVDNVLRKTLDQYKSVLHPQKLDEIYKHMPQFSQDIAKALPKTAMNIKEAEIEFEKEYFTKLLADHQGNLSQTAKAAKIRYETLLRKLKKLGISH